jgi:hypothetical protein
MGYELPVQRDDIIELSGKTDFGKLFIKENGNKFEVVKIQTWGEHQLLLRILKKENEIGLIWINLLPTSRNFKIYKDDILI